MAERKESKKVFPRAKKNNEAEVAIELDRKVRKNAK